MRRRRSGKAYRKQFCSIILAAALVMGSVMPAFAAEGGTIDSEEETAVSESAAENGAVDETEQITSGEGTEQVASGDGSEQVTSGDGTDQVMTDENQVASDDQEKPEEEEPAPEEETDVVADQNTGLDPAADEPVEGATVPEVSVSVVEGIGDDDSEEMFAEYVERLFEGEGTRKRAKKAVGSKFEGAALYLYTELRNGAEQVASGQRPSTEFAFDVEDLGYGSSNAWSASELGVEAVVVGGKISDEAKSAAFQKFEEELQASAILNALLADCPYELYWYDKTQGVTKGSGIGATSSGGECKCYISGSYTFRFAVASEFSAGQYTADTNKTGAATAAVSNAQDILSAANGLSDMEKLNYYKEEICDLVSYNDAAAGGGIAYGNPWQLVWVFDGDTSTNVVCEGYSKAFQYLCDKTNFSSNRVSAISPTGVMSGGMGEGRHMWNIVTLDDGWNYLADVTNSDTGTVGSDGDLFLVPYTSGSVEDGYVFLCFGTEEIHYSYDADCIDLFSAENLTISANPYGTNPLPEPLEITSQPQDVIATDGQNITLHVEANKTDVSYQWQWSEDGENWVNCTFDGAFTDTLSFMAKEIVHGMYFRCVVSNTNESVNSEAAQVMVDPIEHSYGDWVVTVEPTCTEDGIREKVCTICGDKVTEAIPATGHAYGDWTVTKEATCTEDGSREKVCGNCGDKITETISATGHAYGDWTVTKEATCTEDGSREKVCGNCGDKITETISATGHDYSDWTVTKEATCTEDGSREKTCANCGDKITETIAAIGHVWKDEYTVDKEATCTEEGSESIHCSVCGAIDETTVRVIPKKEHTYGDWTVTKEATCTEDGSREKVCANCGDKITEEIPATGHAWTEWIVVREATEEEEGLERRTCSNDPSHTEEKIIPKLTHVHELIKTEAKEASCTEDGNVEFWTCSKCGRVYSDSEGVNEINPEETIIHATGHKWNTEYTVDKEATCTEEGSESIHCSVCDAIDETTVRAIPATGHAYGDWTVTKEATCTEDGSRERVCANCGDKETETINANGHIWEEEYTVDKVATCTEEGSESIHCSVCDVIDETTVRAIPKIEHAYGDWTVTKKATCTEDGSREKVCANCGDKITETITATGHAYGDWTVTKEATCTEDGSRERVCANCGDKETETINANGHIWEEEYTVDKVATCTEEGSESIHCSVCGLSDENSVQVIPKKEHTYGDWTVTKEATCTEDGSREKVCSNCGDKITETIPADGHAYGDWTVTTEATCTEDGSEERVCVNCGYKETKTIPATGHIWNDYYTRDVEPTETEEGSESKHCSVCDAINESTVTPIPVLKGTWKQDRNGWWYDRGNGTYPKDGFEEIKGVTYYFDASGYMKTGWVEDDGDWYYFAASGAMVKDNWQQSGSTWYYFGEDGKMLSGLQEINGTSYFFKDSGAMATGWQEIDGDWYYFAGSGAMVKKNWQQSGNTWYYFGEDGKMLTGLQEINGKSYFFKDSGAMATGWQEIDGDWYYFDASGAMVKENWQQSGNSWYYFDGEGKMLTGLQEIGGRIYFFKDSGAMVTGWQQVGDDWYYFESSGAAACSKWVGNYYMDETGVMVTNDWVDNHRYYVGADGLWIPGYVELN